MVKVKGTQEMKKAFDSSTWFEVTTDIDQETYENRGYTAVNRSEVVSDIISVNESYGMAVVIFKSDTQCTRCGGAGGWRGWPGFTCFRCNGSGKEHHRTKTKLYTWDRIEKVLAAKNIKFKAKQDAKNEERNQLLMFWENLKIENNFLNEIENIIASGDVTRDISFASSVINTIKNRGQASESQINVLKNVWNRVQATTEKKNSSNFIGVVGAKTESTLTLKFEKSFSGVYGITFLQIFNDENGNAVSYMGASPMNLEKDETVKVKFTVKAHEEYKGEKQTKIIRAKIQ